MASVNDDAPAPDGPSTPSTLGEGTSHAPGLGGGALFPPGLASQLCEALPRGGGAPGPGGLPPVHAAAAHAIRGIAPRDPLEAMLAVQLVAVHAASMECFRRAHLPEQSFEARQANLAQANRLVRSYAALVEALDKHRGKGQPQVVRVERVTVEAGGQAIVGALARGGGGGGG